MATLKTQQNNASVSAFLGGIEDPDKRKDAKALLKIFKEATGMKPKMWGDSIVGFGSYYYKSERSTQEGEWMLTAFSPRKAQFSIYIMPGVSKYDTMLKKLGKHKKSKGSCLYIKKLADVDTTILHTLIQTSVKDMQRMYTTK